LAAIVESSDDAIISKDLTGIIQTWNRGAERIFGYAADEMIGQSILHLIPKELHDQEPMILGKIARGERIERFETIRQRKDGTTFHVSLTISPIRDPGGKIVGASKIGRDITDLRVAQERQDILLRELNHRVKNLFAVANGVVSLSARSAATPQELAQSVKSRLSALSRAHELILPRHAGESDRVVDLTELVTLVVAPYDLKDKRISVSGPPVQCGSSMATSMALLLHEFATNSVKYGALGHAEGRIHVTWNRSEGAVEIAWVEQGTTKSENDAAGFGSFLVEATAKSLDARINRSWTDNGLTIAMVIPADRFSI
jgi:PAS domain S-box-containing protein